MIYAEYGSVRVPDQKIKPVLMAERTLWGKELDNLAAIRDRHQGRLRGSMRLLNPLNESFKAPLDSLNLSAYFLTRVARMGVSIFRSLRRPGSRVEFYQAQDYTPFRVQKVASQA